MKNCPTCKECKDDSLFYKNKSRKDGLCDSCKSCSSMQNKKSSEVNKCRIKEARKKYRSANKEAISESQKASVARNKQHYDDYRRNYSQLNREMLRIKANVYYANNKEKVKEKTRNTRLKNPALCMLKAAKRRAGISNLFFNIELEDIVVPLFCPILNIPFIIGEGHPCPNSPSLDRKIPELGYVKENIQVISHKANTMKNNATISELLRFKDWVRSIGTSHKVEDNGCLWVDKRRWITNIKCTSKRDGIPFDLTVDDIILPEYCPVLGVKFEKYRDKTNKWCTPSIDKIEPKLGYVKGNIQVICRKANTMKSDASLGELQMFANWIESTFNT